MLRRERVILPRRWVGDGAPFPWPPRLPVYLPMQKWLKISWITASPTVSRAARTGLHKRLQCQRPNEPCIQVVYNFMDEFVDNPMA